MNVAQSNLRVNNNCRVGLYSCRISNLYTESCAPVAAVVSLNRTNMTDLRAIVHLDPEIHSGDPVFVGTRVPVRTLLDYIEGGDSLEVFLDNFPGVTREQAIAFLEHAAQVALAQIA